MDGDDPAAEYKLAFSGRKRSKSRSRSHEMASLMKSDSTTSDKHKSLPAKRSASPRGGLVKMAVSGLKKWSPLSKIKAALRKKSKKQQSGVSSSASRKQVHELKLENPSEKQDARRNNKVALILENSTKQAGPHTQQLEDKRDRLVETEEPLSTEHAYPEAKSSKEVSEPEYRQGTEMESTAPGNLKLDAMHSHRSQIDEDPNGSIDNKSESRTDNFTETRWHEEHANNLGIEAAEKYNEDLQYPKLQAHVKLDRKLYDNGEIEKPLKVEELEDASNVLFDEMKEVEQVANPMNETNEAKQEVDNTTNDLVSTKFSYTEPAISRSDNETSTWVPTDPLSQVPGLSNTLDQLAKNPRVESIYTKQSYTKPASSRSDNDLDLQTDKLAKVKEDLDKLELKDEELNGLLLKTVDNLEPMNLENCRNQANAEFSSEASGGKLKFESDKIALVKYPDLKMVRPTQANQMFHEAGDNLHGKTMKSEDPNDQNCNESVERRFNTSKAQRGQPTKDGWKAVQEGTVKVEKKNRGSTAETALVKDKAWNNCAVGFPEKISAIHDFCLGIPYGCLVIAESLFWFLATWRSSPFSSGVLLGGLILASSISSLKAWSEGCSSRTHIKAQAAIALTICAQALPNIFKAKLLSPNAHVGIISGAMVAFYAYVYFFGKNVQGEKK